VTDAESAPAQHHDDTPPRRTTAWAVASLVLGGVGTLLGLVPIVGVVTLVLGPLAFVSGVVGLVVRSRMRPLAGGGMILGITGIVVAGIVSEKVSDELQGMVDFVQLKPEAVELGEMVETSSYEIVVMDVDNNAKVADTLQEPTEPEGKYVAVSVAVKNTAGDTKTFWNDGQKLVDAEGEEYEPDGAAARIMEHSNALLDETDPGEVVAGELVYDIPEKADPAYLRSDETRFIDSARVALD